MRSSTGSSPLTSSTAVPRNVTESGLRSTSAALIRPVTGNQMSVCSLWKWRPRSVPRREWVQLTWIPSPNSSPCSESLKTSANSPLASVKTLDGLRTTPSIDSGVTGTNDHLLLFSTPGN
jgi:hypothetical protein